MMPSFEIKDLQRLTVRVAEDLLAHSQELPEVDEKLRGAWREARDSGRTAASFEAWRDDWVDQVAVAWVLGCVFVRYLEDNGLIEDCWLAGEGARVARAEEAQEGFFRDQPELSDREYLEHVFRVVGGHPATRELFAEKRTPIWDLGPSGDGAMALLKFWREVDPETGRLKRSFSGEDGDTRFLGDLYQELSEAAKKKYALLQTPDFVEAFILDHTLEPALSEFGLETARMIDPTCGSGHFLLGAFHRLFERWQKQEPGGNPVVLAQRALDAVHGVDVNPFAVAIARFRLILAAMHVCGIRRLAEAPGWKLNLAVGDSLLHGAAWDPKGVQIGRGKDWFGETEDEVFAEPALALEDSKEVRRILGQPYHAVVGNPPYITVKDKALGKLYRERFGSCHRSYALVVPFAERFFQLCVSDGGERVGHVGMIVANSFMKREFGKKLIEEFFGDNGKYQVDLERIIDTSGAYIPGHGTPTVILFGRNRKPVGSTVRAVLGIRGEPKTPEDPAQGLVWSAILSQLDKPGSESDFVSVADMDRESIGAHPWSLTGGGAVELKERIESAASSTLSDHVQEIGFGAVTREDEAFRVGRDVARRHGIDESQIRPLVAGEEVRDWSLVSPVEGIWPYAVDSLEALGCAALKRFLWPWKTQLSDRVAYGKTQIQRGLEWFEYSMFFKDRYRTPLSIAFGEIATHNHFVLDRGGKVFKQTAPIIKLPPDATEDDHLALLGLLNSSVACFWLKQMCFPKGGDQVGTQGARVRKTLWDERYAFDGTKLGRFPVVDDRPVEQARRIDQLAAEAHRSSPDELAAKDSAGPLRFETPERDYRLRRAQLLYLQEELDWHCYRLYGLLDEDLTYSEDLPCGLALGERAFEIVLARKVEAGDAPAEWFERHGSSPRTGIPSHLPEDYRQLVQRRLDRIESDPDIRLLEAPENKRRWSDVQWAKKVERALRGWLADRLEDERYWPRANVAPTLSSVGSLADSAPSDEELFRAAELYRGRSDFDLAALIVEIVQAESVPFLPKLRYKTPGLRKRSVWEKTWELQRAEDRGENAQDIPVPPKYKSSDFLKQDYWRLRGKLDVPKERFISFPHCERDGDPTLVVLWAGYDHLQQAQAIAAYYQRMKDQEGWSPQRLQPLLAGLDQLVPWLLQWHNELDPEYQLRMGDYFKTFLETEARELGFTLEEVRRWCPPKRAAQRRKKRASKA